MPIQTLNPATGQVEKNFDELSDEQISQKLSLATSTFPMWRDTAISDRSALMKKAAENLRQNTDSYAEIITREMGKPITQAKAEVQKCASVCDYYADNAQTFLQNEVIETEAQLSYVSFEPIGAVFAVMPWNYPLWQVFRFAAPALMAGNVALLKHASNVPQSALIIEKVFQDAGFNAGVFQTLLISSSKVNSIIEHDIVQAVTLTGSEYAGSQVAQAAGKNIKKSVLELGGSDPLIVLADADIEKAACIGCTARLQNTGQTCIAAKRYIVNKDIAPAFIERIKSEYEKQVIGDPLVAETTIGPMVSLQGLEEIEEQVNKSIEMGATVVVGGKRLERDGYYFEPTILTDLTSDMPAYKDELFGPVASLIIVDNDDEAVRIANGIPYGLGASIFTENIEKGKELARRIEAGCVFINEMVKSHTHLPFGGVKKSGYGRELSHYGIKEFVNIKTVYVK